VRVSVTQGGPWPNIIVLLESTKVGSSPPYIDSAGFLNSHKNSALQNLFFGSGAASEVEESVGGLR
jgi:hypothetical protein